MDKKTIVRRLWDSLEMHHYKVNLGVTAVFLCILWFPFIGRDAVQFWITTLIALPFFGFYAYRFFRIFRSPEDYIFTRCKLENFHISGLARTACFSVRLEIPEVGIVNDETALIFATHGAVAPVLEDYVNREVLVAYNRTTGQIVVIG